jgi:hypothetical protein
MDQPTTPIVRHDGWTRERQALFLDCLAERGNVRLACARAGMSPEAAYRLRRRDALFARGWAVALVLAREHSGQALGDRALDGVEEEVWYRGEVVGTRRRYDNRLLLAHVARLDKLAEGEGTAAADARRFDELLARVAGVALPGDLANDGDLPLTREQCIVQAGTRERTDAGWRRAQLAAAARWDEWLGTACATVDALLATGTPSTSSTSSTSAPSAGRSGSAG